MPVVEATSTPSTPASSLSPLKLSDVVHIIGAAMDDPANQ
jgi:hypothetical protein